MTDQTNLSQSANNSNTRVQLILALLQVALPTISGAVLGVITQDPIKAILAIVAMAFTVFVARKLIVFVSPALGELEREAQEDFNTRAKFWRDSKFRKPYFKYLYYQCRTLDVKGLSTQGPYALDLERVFVDLSISPESKPSDNPIPHELREGGHSIWKYLTAESLQHLAIIGAPGSGKTTLIKYMTLTLIGRSQRFLKDVPNKLPVFLVLREHAKTIVESPQIRLAEVIYQSLARMEEQAPTNWFEQHLRHGQCVIMLDGLDEIGNLEDRRMLVKWIKAQMRIYSDNNFIITSRPYGYQTNPISELTSLEIRPFSHKQMRLFVYNWYLANEIMSHLKYDEGVKIEAEKGAEALIQLIENTPDIAQLAVNPLLLTMIANIHRFRAHLPGRRVELYAQMCDVFLSGSRYANPLASLTSAQQQSILQPLAYEMMKLEKRELPLEDVLEIISTPISLLPTEMNSRTFLDNIQTTGGIFLEMENGIYGFSSKTFQEYLAAVHAQIQKMEDELIKNIQNDFWHETIRLYCSLTDATAIISACLSQIPLSIAQLILALECYEEALRVQPKVRAELEVLIDEGVEHEDRERQRFAAEVLLTRKLRGLPPSNGKHKENVQITHAEYQLFLEKHPENTPPHWQGTHFPKGTGKVPVVGISSVDAVAFCDWLNAHNEYISWHYRIPKRSELQESDPFWVTTSTEKLQLSHEKPQELSLSSWVLTGDWDMRKVALPSVTLKVSCLDLDYMMRYLTFITPIKFSGVYGQALNATLARINKLARHLKEKHNLATGIAHISSKTLPDADDFLRTIIETKNQSSTDKLEPAHANAFARANALDLASARALVLARDFARALDLDIASDLPHANTTAQELKISKVLTLEIGRATKSTLALAVTHIHAYTFARALAYDVAHLSKAKPEYHSLLLLFKQTAEIVYGYLILSLVLDPDTKLKELADFRRYMLEAFCQTYNEQPQKPRFSKRRDWELWKQKVDTMLNDFATLAIIERRNTGEWEPFETLRVVKEPRRDDLL